MISCGFYLFYIEFTKIQNINLNYGKSLKIEDKAKNYNEIFTNNEINIENFNDENNNLKTKKIF